MSHSTDADEDIEQSVKAAQRARMLAWLREARRRRARLAVVELGCGVSPHSLRLDAEIAVAAQRDAGGVARLVRVDPGDDCAVPRGAGFVALRLGAAAALARICPR